MSCFSVSRWSIRTTRTSSPYRVTDRTHGPNHRPASDWLDRNLLLTANLHDIGATVTQWETGAIFLRRGIAQGEVPFWDPYVGGGAPAMSQLLHAFFFPPFMILIALGNGVLLKNVYFLLLLLMAGWCTWALLRRSGLSWLASLVGGLTFMLSGALSQTVGGFLGQTACCMPVALLATRWFLERATWTATAVLALVYASVSLASFPPVLLAVFGLSAVYACAELAVRRRMRDRPAARGSASLWRRVPAGLWAGRLVLPARVLR